MRLHSALGISVAVLALGSTGHRASAQTGGEAIVVGQQFKLRSESIGEMRTYQVHRPADYDASNARYPVLIVLDGEEHFQHASSTVDFLSTAGRIPAMLVVGIPNTDRYRDMDTTDVSSAPRFLKFIKDELIPKVDRDYRTRPYRILVGHSGAGLYALYSLMHAPDVFRGYVVIAPAFGDDRELPKTIDAFLQQQRDLNLNADLFLTADNSPGQGLTGAWELSSYLNERATSVRDLRFTFRRYSESHATVPLVSVYEGLQSIFNGWALDPEEAFALYEQGGLAAIDKHFTALSTRFGFAVPLPDEVLFRIFSDLESLKRFAEAEQVINKAIELFPQSPTALYYAGRLYLQMGNRALAVETLRKSLLLSPDYGPSRGLLEYIGTLR
jgi:predicted alpha/beta superfamily hydrolase